MIARGLLELAKLSLAARLPPGGLSRLQDHRLRRLVSHAYHNVPYYRDLFDSAGISPADIRTTEDLPRIPLTSKEDLAGLPVSEKTARGTDPQTCVTRLTSGSSGAPFCTWLTAEDILQRTLVDLRAMRAGGIGLTDKLLIIKDLKDESRKTQWFQRAGILRREYIDLLTDREAILERLLRNDFDVLGGPTAEISILAEEILASGRSRPRPRAVIVGAEILDSKRRDLIRKAFGVAPVDFYGATEVGHIAWQCPQRSGYHINADILAVEIVSGEVVVTHLGQRTMPFIRYRLGDMASLSAKPCPCGCGLPMLKEISGRIADCIQLPSGNKISPYTLTCSIEDIEGLKSYQITQKTPNEIEVTYVAPPARSRAVSSQIRKRLAGLVGGEISVSTRRTDRIQGEKGKFKVVQRLR